MRLPRPYCQHPPLTLRYGKCMASPLAGHGVSGAAGAGLQALRVAARAFDMIRLTDMDSGISLSGPQAVSAPVPGTLTVHTAAPVGMNLDTGL